MQCTNCGCSLSASAALGGRCPSCRVGLARRTRTGSSTRRIPALLGSTSDGLGSTGRDQDPHISTQHQTVAASDGLLSIVLQGLSDLN